MSEAPSFTCPRCGRTSHNPNDVREGYCGACHDWTGPGRDIHDGRGSGTGGGSDL